MHRKYRTDRQRTFFIGIDGEGQGRKNHRYVYLAASDEGGNRTWEVNGKHFDEESWKDKLLPEQIPTVECLEMILSLPTKRTKIFSFSFAYDITKIITDLDDRSIYDLFRPEVRKRKKEDPVTGKKIPAPELDKFGPYPIKWPNPKSGPYLLNMQGTKFVVQRGKKRVVVWDLFKFFQAKFVNALKDWKVGDPELLKRMSIMKDKRSEFDKESPNAVKAYCLEECACIAELARKLVESHEEVGLKLKSFYGAGSSGGAMLSAMGIKKKIAPCIPEMKVAVGSAFFGGRFEHSVIGSIEQELEGWDISSAYPYHITFLPCLEHGFWKHTTRRKDLEQSRHALVRYALQPRNEDHRIILSTESWGPFPFRESDGSICFPITSGGGWVWKDEYLQGEKLFNHVQFVEAWIYDCQCECQPFAKVPDYYRQRIRIGKEGPGIVIKLGLNSCYGKLAQSVGNAVYNSWIWAGIITSGCRSQILELLGLHKDRSNMLMVATDGIYTREKLIAPVPRDTGTWEMLDDKGKIVHKPLGGWEKKLAPKGVFFARPGIYFPIGPTEEEIKDIKGRGVGKGVVFDNWKEIVRVWEREGVKGIARVANVSRFCGAKTSVSYSKGQGYNRADGQNAGQNPSNEPPRYGQWITRRIEMSFNPLPKRERVNPDGVTLKLRELADGLMSAPYNRVMHWKAPESVEMRKAMEEIMEQPDADLAEYDLQDEGF